MLFEIRVPGKESKMGEGIASHYFVDACQALLRAKEAGYLSIPQLKIAKAAAAILNYLEHQTIDAAIEEATGYKLYKENIKIYLQQFLVDNLNDNAFAWVRTLPDDFFYALSEIHSLGWKTMHENPYGIGKLIHEVVFSRLNDQLLFELRANVHKRQYVKKNTKLMDSQNPELKKYISGIMTLLEASRNNWNIFLQLLNRSYPKNPNFTIRFPVGNESRAKSELSSFNVLLKNISS